MLEGGRGRTRRQPRAQPAPNRAKGSLGYGAGAVFPQSSCGACPPSRGPAQPCLRDSTRGYSTIARAPSSLSSRTIPSGRAPPWRCQHQG
eukprot:scaffold5505_cov129-Isochrysis_galbana.AAC.3